MSQYNELITKYSNDRENIKVRNELIIFLSDYTMSNIDDNSDDTYNLYKEKLSELLRGCQDNEFLFEKVLLSYMNNNLAELMETLLLYIECVMAPDMPPDMPLIYDEIYKHLVENFDDRNKDHFKKSSEKLDSVVRSISLIIFGSYIVYEEEDSALELFEKLYDEDSSNWVPPWFSAGIYSDQGNWRQAIKSYELALKTDSQILREDGEVFFDLAWCYGKIKEYSREEYYYRKCLEYAPEFENALNNLGYSLVRQKKYAEALQIFNKCIKENRDGNFPYYNKVRALKGLKKYKEALEFINESITKGKVTLKSMASDIEKLNKWIMQSKSFVTGSENYAISEAELEEDLEKDESYIEVSENEIDKSPKKETFATPNERVLEELLEKHILDGNVTFDRNLSMYDDDRYYGRQLIIPDIGRIDLLTVDNDTNDLVVVELKQGKSDDVVVGQILRYMGWLKEKLANDHQNVIGVICVNEITPKLKSAASVVPTIEVYEYGISLTKVN